MIGFVLLLCLFFRWGVLHRVLLVVGWFQVLYSSGFLSESSHYLIPHRVSSREGNGTPLQYSFAWETPWTEEPGGLQSMGSLRVRHNWATSLSLFTFMHWRRKWQPTPLFLPGESQGRGKPRGLLSMGSHRIEHNWSDAAAAVAAAAAAAAYFRVILEYFLIKVYTFCRHNAIAHSIDYSVV